MKTCALLVAVLLGCASPGLGEEPGLASRLSRVAERAAAARSGLTAGRPPAWKEIRAIEAELVDLLRRDPENPAVAEALGGFYSDWRDLEGPAPGLLALVEQSRDPVLLARRIRGERGGGPAVVRVLLAALAARPAEPVLWKLAADSSPPPEWRAAFLEEALRTLGGRAPGAAEAVAGELVDVELSAGFTAEALTTLEGLPPAVRSRLLSGPLPALNAGAEGPPLTIPGRDLRLDLAIAQALAGDSGRAAGLEKALPPLEPEPARGWLVHPPARPVPGDPDRRARRLLDRWLRPTPDDPFDLLADSLSVLRSPWRRDRLLLLARLAEREGYPGMAAYAERYALLGMARKADPLEGARGLPPRVSATAHRLAAARESLRQGFRSVKSARPLRPPHIRFEERALPGGPSGPGTGEENGRGIGGEAWLRRPRDFPSLKFDQEGDRAAMVGWYPDRDPRLAPGIGSYWVVLSQDRGKTWSPPLYTGIREKETYRLHRGSVFPLLAGDRLQLEVLREENDPAYAVPPASIGRPRTRTESLRLTLPLADLRRDSDGDGLTDLLEQELLTDPGDPDTDRDGLPDAADPLPGVAFADGPVAASRAAAFASALEEILRRDPRVYEPGESPVSGLADFLVSDPGVFGGFQPVRRTIVLSPQEAGEAREKLHLEIRLWIGFFSDRSGRRALAIWSLPDEGGVLHLEDSGRGWDREVFDAWTV